MPHETRPLLSSESSRPESPTGLQARKRGENGAPAATQCIAHRGYKAKHPENTMAAFRAAADVGADAIETDLHLSRDGVVVLSHDRDLKRCFGIDKLISECDWSYLQSLSSVQAPHEPMASLEELLEFLAGPSQEKMWLILDVKTDDDAEELVTKTAETIASASEPTRPWDERIVLGCWNKSYLDLAQIHLPTHQRCLINASTIYAAPLIRTPDLSFSLHYLLLAGPLGALFRAAASAGGNPVLAWTINSRSWMEWAVCVGLDGVVTNEVELCLDVVRGRGAASEKASGWTSAAGRGAARRGLGAVWDAVWLSAVHVLAVLVVAIYMVLGGGGVRRRKSRPRGGRKDGA